MRAGAKNCFRALFILLYFICQGVIKSTVWFRPDLLFVRFLYLNWSALRIFFPLLEVSNRACLIG